MNGSIIVFKIICHLKLAIFTSFILINLSFSESIYSHFQLSTERENILRFHPSLQEFRGPYLSNTLMYYHDRTGSSLWNNNSNMVVEEEQCEILYEKSLIQLDSDRLGPSRELSANDSYYFFMGGRVHFEFRYFDDSFQFNKNAPTYIFWSMENFNKYFERDRSYMICYGFGDCDFMLNKFASEFVAKKHGIVIGSQTPWAESLMLIYGASLVTTIEYASIISEHPQNKVNTPKEIADLYLNGTFEKVDFAFSYSSLEHDGLGRYGDPINPFGDLESMIRIRCLLKKGGVFFFSVPVGMDGIAWNAHRVYGKYRLALITIGWEILDYYPAKSISYTDTFAAEFQPILLLRKL